MQAAMMAQRAGCRPFLAARPVHRPNVIVRSGWGVEKAFFGENMGARDPTPGELASNFGEKVIGNFDTNHLIKPPDKIKQHIGLSGRTCKDEGEEGLVRVEGKDFDLYKNQVYGWKVVAHSSGKGECLQQQWKLKDAAAAGEFAARVAKVAESEGYAPASVTTTADTVMVEIINEAKGGLVVNDFILAGKLNDIVTADLVPKKRARYWA